MEAAAQTIDALVEEARLAVLDDYEVLDSAPEEDFDQLVWLAAELCDAPIALVSLVDRDRLFFKSRFGIEQTEMPRGDAGLRRPLHRARRSARRARRGGATPGSPAFPRFAPA